MGDNLPRRGPPNARSVPAPGGGASVLKLPEPGGFFLWGGGTILEGGILESRMRRGPLGAGDFSRGQRTGKNLFCFFFFFWSAGKGPVQEGGRMHKLPPKIYHSEGEDAMEEHDKERILGEQSFFGVVGAYRPRVKNILRVCAKNKNPGGVAGQGRQPLHPRSGGPASGRGVGGRFHGFLGAEGGRKWSLYGRFFQTKWGRGLRHGLRRV